jgi:hypothetical protein
LAIAELQQDESLILLKLFFIDIVLPAKYAKLYETLPQIFHNFRHGRSAARL